MAEANEISMDAVLVTVLSEPGRILKVTKKGTESLFLVDNIFLPYFGLVLARFFG